MLLELANARPRKLFCDVLKNRKFFLEMNSGTMVFAMVLKEEIRVMVFAMFLELLEQGNWKIMAFAMFLETTTTGIIVLAIFWKQRMQ